jgi:hypothetical protein
MSVVLASSTNGEQVRLEIDGQQDPAKSATVLAEVLERDSTLTEVLTADPEFDPQMHILVRESDGSLKKYRRIKLPPQDAKTVLHDISTQQWCPHCQQHVTIDHACETRTERFYRLLNPGKGVTVLPARDRKSPNRRLQDAMIAQELGCSSERAAGILPVDGYPPAGEPLWGGATHISELAELTARTLRRLQGPVFQDTGLVLLGPEDAS